MNVISAQGLIAGQYRVDISWLSQTGLMDTTVVPNVGSFAVIVDGGARALQSVAWQSPSVLRFGFFPPNPATSVRIVLTTVDLDLRDSLGLVAMAPQERTTTGPFPP